MFSKRIPPNKISQILQLHILKLVSQIDEFDKIVRQKLMNFDEKLNKFERTVDYFNLVKQPAEIAEGDVVEARER